MLSSLISLAADLSVGSGLALIGAGIAVFTGFGSGIGEGNIAAHAMDAIGRNPEATSNIRSNMVMGIAFGTVVTVFRNSLLPSYKGTYNQNLVSREYLKKIILSKSAIIFQKTKCVRVLLWRRHTSKNERTFL